MTVAEPRWAALMIGGGAAVGKTVVARGVAAHYSASVLPVDTIWVALKSATGLVTHPKFHDDPTDAELELPIEELCRRHIETAEAISEVLGAVIEYYRWEESSVVLEGAWITPAAATRWARDYQPLRSVFIHEPDVEQVLAAMLLRSGRRTPTRRDRALAEVCWRFGNWVRQHALAGGLPVVSARPRDTLVERVLVNLDTAR